MQKINDRLLSWASDIDPGTILQAEKTARLPIVTGHVALMPDAHVGIGATVGSVIPTADAIIPSAVGVDIGCGMIAARINKQASDLPTNLDKLLPLIERAVPAGVGKGHDVQSSSASQWIYTHRPVSKLTPKQEATAGNQFGTLGSGNHFFEVCLDENDNVWIVLHSGSRGIGNQLANVHINKAKALAKSLALGLEDPDLAYFTQGTSEFAEYIGDMLWAQEYAMANREQMMRAATKVVLGSLPPDARVVDTINCHHNFTARETHQGRELWITRKGAIRAGVGDRGVIPGSMGTRSYIVSGLGNPDSWQSCSHGAGRKMSRGEARRTFSADDLRQAMVGKSWLIDRADSLIDEIPASYKSIDQVMADQNDLVKITHTLHQVLNFKGT
jgi:tRNA-splicing ligase RtcB